MRPEPNLLIERYRITHGKFASPSGVNYGAFKVPSCGGFLRIISSGNIGEELMGWEHVSVSLDHRCPNWSEMAKVKHLFWEDEETVIQFHPRKDAHVNYHPYCLHLWKQIGHEYELPPRDLIGP